MNFQFDVNIILKVKKYPEKWQKGRERKCLLLIPATLGIPLDFKYDRENRKVIFTCVNEKEMLENE